ncbi:MAG TPA: hypothetical protein VG714_07025, partial [Acidobacteriaceae bacterium]|nr:hypothetical protein [Acidobacteriaceae bacterium]
YNPQGAPPPPPGYSQGSPDQNPSNAQGYPPPPPGYPSYPQGPGYAQQQPRQPYSPPAAYTGQQGGETVTIPAGAQLQVRITQTLDSSRTAPGTRFDGIVVNDIAAGNSIAIPRGATVHGTVIDAKSSGAVSGRGQLSLQLTSVNLGGRDYPIVSDVWAHNGADKAAESVDKTIIGGALGALVGAAAGGGQGAAIGAGVGGALGLGSSAASHNGQVFIPSEGLLTFHLAQPATVATVSQAEMNRLAQAAGPAAGPPALRRRGYYAYPAPYYYGYYGPRYYRAYPYPY